MPTYTIKDNKTGNTWEVICSYEELQKTLDEVPNTSQVLSAPKIVSGVGSLQKKVPSGFKDVLSRVKSGSGQGNTVKN